MSHRVWNTGLKRRVSWLLAILLVAQYALIGNAHSAANLIVADEAGRYVLVCTTEGLIKVPVDEFSQGSSSTAEALKQCSTCTLSSMLGAVIHSDPVQDFQPSELSFLATDYGSHIRALRSLSTPIRAPPTA
ncbi:hypothetical protein [Motiliproteus sp.]|uniref:hypothetical protein n=1 Tax=Motiliproteus sp. TaxID=1898955 RepID=UPI003BA8B711